MVRLVKGAYWDSEIKMAPGARPRRLSGLHAQGHDRRLLSRLRAGGCSPTGEAIYPAVRHAQRAHAVGDRRDGGGNVTATSSSSACTAWARRSTTRWSRAETLGIPARIYAPVGSHEDLLAYLVRRLLENGANTSFVNRIVDETAPIDEIVADPVAQAAQAADQAAIRASRCRRNLFGAERRELAPASTSPIRRHLRRCAARWSARRRESLDVPRRCSAAWRASGAGRAGARSRRPPPRRRHRSTEADAADVKRAMRAARAHARRPGTARRRDERAACLDRAADLLERDARPADGALRARGRQDHPRRAGRGARGGRFLPLLRRARAARISPHRWRCPGRPASATSSALHGRGVFACIRPWNFPLAIFTRPGRRGAGRRQRRDRQAGRADAADRRRGGAAAAPGRRARRRAASAAGRRRQRSARRWSRDPRIAGVAFTGSTDTARGINRALAAQHGPIVPLIAETGGQNAMIVDSSALPEQVVRDVLISAFQSAGQRCSALRVLFVQEDIAED